MTWLVYKDMGMTSFNEIDENRDHLGRTARLDIDETNPLYTISLKKRKRCLFHISSNTKTLVGEIWNISPPPPPLPPLWEAKNLI